MLNQRPDLPRVADANDGQVVEYVDEGSAGPRAVTSLGVGVSTVQRIKAEMLAT
jgi:hypothetical protein